MNLEHILSWLRIHIVSLLTPPKTIQMIDIVQIILLAWLIYKVIMWMRNTRAYTLLKGMLVVFIFVIVANLLKMDVLIWLFGNLSVVAF